MRSLPACGVCVILLAAFIKKIKKPPPVPSTGEAISQGGHGTPAQGSIAQKPAEGKPGALAGLFVFQPLR